MEWTALPDENGYRRLAIEAPWEEIAGEYEELVTRYAATVGLPGFRPGKAPRGAVAQRFRAEILADLSARTVERLGRDAVRETGIEPLGPLEASGIECDRGRPLLAVLRFLPLPDFRLPDLAELETEDDGSDPRDRISRRLLELAPFEVPGELVRRELAHDGVEEIAPGSDAWNAAAERIRLMVILGKIARQEGIEVDETDLDRRIAEKAESFATTKRQLEAELARGGGTARLRDMLLAERTLEYLMEIGHRSTRRR